MTVNCLKMFHMSSFFTDSILTKGSLFVFPFVWKEAMNAQDDGFPFLFSAFSGLFLYGNVVSTLLSTQTLNEDFAVGTLAIAAIATTFLLETPQAGIFSMMNLFDVTSGTYGPAKGSHRHSIFPLSQKGAISNLLPIFCNFGVVSGKVIGEISSLVGPHAASVFWHLALLDYVLRLLNNTSSSKVMK